MHGTAPYTTDANTASDDTEMICPDVTAVMSDGCTYNAMRYKSADRLYHREEANEVPLAHLIRLCHSTFDMITIADKDRNAVAPEKV